MTAVKNKAYFDKIRRNNLNEYLSPRVQKELMRQAMRQGDAFYETAPSTPAAKPSREPVGPVDGPETDFNDENFDDEDNGEDE